MVRGLGPIPRAEIAGEFWGFVFLVLQSSVWKKCGRQGCAWHICTALLVDGVWLWGPKVNFQFSFLGMRTKGAPVASVVWVFYFLIIIIFCCYFHIMLGIGRNWERSSNPVPLLEQGILFEQRKIKLLGWNITILEQRCFENLLAVWPVVLRHESLSWVYGFSYYHWVELVRTGREN